jgi:hypothetical protein
MAYSEQAIDNNAGAGAGAGAAVEVSGSAGIPASVLQNLFSDYETRPKDHELPFSRSVYAKHHGHFRLRALMVVGALAVATLGLTNTFSSEVPDTPFGVVAAVLAVAAVILLLFAAQGAYYWGEKPRMYVKDGWLVFQKKAGSTEHNKGRYFCCGNIERVEMHLTHAHIFGDIIEVSGGIGSEKKTLTHKLTLPLNFTGQEHLVEISKEAIASGWAVLAES